MRGFEAVRSLVQEYQQAHSKPPDAKEARRLAQEFTADLRGRSDENYWLVWAAGALLNQEPFCRYWKPRKETAEDRRRRTAARAKAKAAAMLRKEEVRADGS